METIDHESGPEDVKKYNIRYLLSFFDTLVKDSVEGRDPLPGMDFDDLCDEILARAKESNPLLKERILRRIMLTKHTANSMTIVTGKRVLRLIDDLKML